MEERGGTPASDIQIIGTLMRLDGVLRKGRGDGLICRYEDTEQSIRIVTVRESVFAI